MEVPRRSSLSLLGAATLLSVKLSRLRSKLNSGALSIISNLSYEGKPFGPFKLPVFHGGPRSKKFEYGVCMVELFFMLLLFATDVIFLTCEKTTFQLTETFSFKH
jgi:hypothetical protein